MRQIDETVPRPVDAPATTWRRISIGPRLEMGAIVKAMQLAMLRP